MKPFYLQLIPVICMVIGLFAYILSWLDAPGMALGTLVAGLFIAFLLIL